MGQSASTGTVTFAGLVATTSAFAPAPARPTRSAWTLKKYDNSMVTDAPFSRSVTAMTCTTKHESNCAASDAPVCTRTIAVVQIVAHVPTQRTAAALIAPLLLSGVAVRSVTACACEDADAPRAKSWNEPLRWVIKKAADTSHMYTFDITRYLI
eukprot:CAMPEP_0205905046 /NCGR_PEP_ID=MMETSP1325-20131115/1115_1 /ASSEMBLY_ACC=CAM_ASM_000708 /TAXON_ID=236786 /ORGANISM="Florenciella sp., Strain RCC1007" /LENGTH=153 /DNA_ID=CAMNT_0053270919 /DNA_START=60 /DNA_END=522 /DNA_ORIENTATION=+